MDPAQRFLCINEFGVAMGAMDKVGDLLHEEWKAMNNPAGSRLEILTFGSSDLVTLHSTPDLRLLAITHSRAQVTFQRCYGGAFLSLERPAGPPLYIDPDEAFAALPRGRPFVAITQLKVDPLVNLMVGDAVVDRVLQILPSFLERRLATFERHVDALEVSAPWLRDHVKQWREEAAGDLDRVGILPVAGLDSAELILVLRCADLNALVRVIWALRSLRLRHLHLTQDALLHDRIRQDARDLRLLPGHERTLGQLEGLPLWTYSSTAVGLPRELVAPGSPLADDPSLACRRALLAFRMRSLPGSARATEEQLKLLDAIFAPREQRADHVPGRFTVLGSYDLIYPAGTVIRPGDDEPLLRAPGEYTVAQLVRALGDAPAAGDALGCGYLQETTIAIRAFPPGFDRPDLLSDADGIDTPSAQPGEGVQEVFEDVLHSAQERWMDGSYLDLKRACSERHWPYSATNGALNLVISLVTLLTSRLEIENYLELVPPLEAWVKAVVGPRPRIPEGREADVHRIYKSLDRMMHARSHRDSPHHPPGVSRAFEAKAGYVLPRDAFHAYLSDMAALRLGESTAVLLVDGSDGKLLVKHAGGVSIFIVSALRLHNPLLWPTLAHEIEHVRYERTEIDEERRRRIPELAGAPEPWSPKSLLVRRVEAALRDGSQKETVKQLAACIGAQHHPSGHRTRRWVIEHMLDTACDVAIADSGAIGARDEGMSMRFVAASWPNLVMDLHEEWASLWQAGGAPSPYLAWLTQRVGMRLAGVLALISFAPDAEVTDVEIGRRLSAVMASELWSRALVGLTSLCFGSRGRHDLRWEDPWEDDASSERGNPFVAAAESSLQQLGELVRPGGLWIEGLATIHRLRRASPPGMVERETVGIVAEYLDGLMKRSGWSTPGDVCKSILPRGGLVPGGPAASEDSLTVYSLFNALRGAIRRRRVGAARRLLSPAAATPGSTGRYDP